MRGIFKSIAALTFTCLIVAFTPHTAVANTPNQGCYGSECIGKDPASTSCVNDAIAVGLNIATSTAFGRNLPRKKQITKHKTQTLCFFRPVRYTKKSLCFCYETDFYSHHRR